MLFEGYLAGSQYKNKEIKMSEENKKLTPGQIAYRKALAKKGLTIGGKPLVPTVEEKPVETKQMLTFEDPVEEEEPIPAVALSFVDASICSVCGRPLSRPSSAQKGIGDICEAKMKLLPAGVTLADHYALLQEVDVPDGFILLRDAIEQAKEKGCSGYRFIQACGGDRALHAPFNEHFKVVYVMGKRYVSSLSLQDLPLLVKI
jgi:hypothetical protein